MNTVCKKCFKSVSAVWGCSFILALLIDIIIIAPQRETKKQIGLQLAEKKKIYATISKIDQEKARARLNQRMEEWKDSLKDFVASDEDFTGLTFDIGQIAKDAKVGSFSIYSQDNYGNKDVSDGQYISESQMNVNFNSSFNRFAAFLNAIERHQPVIFVDKFSINHTDNDGSVNRVSMDLSVFTRKRQGS